MKRVILAAVTAALVGTLPGLAQSAGDDELVINADMPRRGPGTTSGSGHTVEANCPTDPSGNAWQDATADLQVTQVGDTSSVAVKVRGAVPNTVFTVWMRMAGSTSGGSIGPNPMNGGGATPLLSGTELDNALSQSPPNAGSSNPANGFTTDKNGNAFFKVDLDFPVVGGAYPFHRASDSAIQALRDAGSSWPLVNIPAAIVNPADAGINGPFLLRVISHCTDNLGHGLSPAVREAWFQYP